MKRERKEKKKENETRRIQRARFQRDYSYPLTDEFITIEDCTRETMEVEYSIEIDKANRVKNDIIRPTVTI